MRYDVLVVGAGLSGLMAAKTAAESGLRTALLGKGMGAIQVLPGGMDLLGYYPEDAATAQHDVRLALRRLIQERPDHPYARVGEQDIDHALRSFCDLFPTHGYHYTGRWDKNIMLPTGMGTMRPSCLVPSTMIAGRKILSESTLLIGFLEFADFFSPYAARNLAHQGGEKGPRVRGESIALSDTGRKGPYKAATLASLFEDAVFRKKMASSIDKLRREERLIGFPAVMGLAGAETVRADLEASLGAEVFELPILPPSIPGIRLFEILKGRLRSAGVAMHLGFEVVSGIRRSGRCQGVVLKTPSGERRFEADWFVLATGGLLGGGLRVKNGRIIEPLFDLPVGQPEEKDGWFREALFSSGGHAIHQVGIMTNNRLNPVDHGGRVLVDNLFVVGSILAHHDAWREQSGSGVAVTTGYKAIRNLVAR
jgi:glycerol-3-phosphate dehydrogenase subunit B